MDPAQQHAAFGGHIAARLHQKAPPVGLLRGPGADHGVQAAAQIIYIQSGFPLVFAVGNAEAAAEVDDFQLVQRGGGQGFGQIQQYLGRVEIAVRLHEQGTDMLVDAGQSQLVPGQQGEYLFHFVRRDAELGFLASRDHLGVVPGPDAGIEAHHDLAAGIEAAQGVQLREGIHADQQAAGQRILKFRVGIVVGNVQNFMRSKAGQLIHEQFAGAHGVHHQTFLADNLQERGIGVGFHRVVDPEAGLTRKGHQIAAALAQDIFIIDIKRCAVGFGQLTRAVIAVKVEAVGISGTDIGHMHL